MQDTTKFAYEVLLNCSINENDSNTPDFILAEFLEQCMDALNKAIVLREKANGEQNRKVDFARQCMGNLFTRGKFAREVLPTKEIEESIACILKYETEN